MYVIIRADGTLETHSRAARWNAVSAFPQQIRCDPDLRGFTRMSADRRLPENLLASVTLTDLAGEKRLVHGPVLITGWDEIEGRPRDLTDRQMARIISAHAAACGQPVASDTEVLAAAEDLYACPDLTVARDFDGVHLGTEAEG